ncbi:hypothetical protein MSKU3_1371 [Komagataeibacter oboediens]|nr:hypothetical protein MSKU3_1371 [Komagataeibacter oboediens]
MTCADQAKGRMGEEGAVALACLALWQGVAMVWPDMIPAPGAVLLAAWCAHDALLTDLQATALPALEGFVIGNVLAVALAVAVAVAVAFVVAPVGACVFGCGGGFIRASADYAGTATCSGVPQRNVAGHPCRDLRLLSNPSGHADRIAGYRSTAEGCRDAVWWQCGLDIMVCAVTLRPACAFRGTAHCGPRRDSGRHPCWVRKRRAGHRVRPAGCNRSWHPFRTMGCGTTGCNVLFRGHVRTGCATGANADGEGCAGNAATGARNGAACRAMGRHAVGRYGLYAAAGDLAVPAMAGRCPTNPVPAAFRRVPLSGHQPMGT